VFGSTDDPWSTLIVFQHTLGLSGAHMRGLLARSMRTRPGPPR
jgi:hypothetical protein